MNPVLDGVNTLYRSLNLRPVETENPELVAFHLKAEAIISEETKAAADAVRAVPQEIKDNIRRARMAGILQLSSAALMRRLEVAAAPMLKKMDQAKAQVEAAMNRCPKDPWDRGYWFARVCEARRQLESVPDLGKRAEIIKKLAEDGSDVFPEAVLHSLTPLLPPGMAEEGFLPLYQEAVAPESLAVIRAAEDDVEEVRNMIKVSRVALATAMAGEIPDAWQVLEQTPVPEIVKAWPSATKTAFLSQRGEAAYTALLSGKVGLATVLDFFRPGLK